MTEWDGPTVLGAKVVKLPTRDIAVSRAWYERVFGARPVLEWADEEDGVVRGYAFDLPGTDLGLALRESPGAAAGLSGFNPVVLAVPDRTAVEAWMTHLDALGVDHSPVIEATVGHLLVFFDPDGLEHHLYSLEPHGRDVSGDPRAGRPVST